MTEKAKQASFTEEFKADAVRLALGESKPMAQVARDLGVCPNTLYNWDAKDRTKHTKRSQSVIVNDENDELHRLRRENRILKEEREILKKAAAFFAKESR